MKIAIAARLRPYSHLPGTFFLIPGSSLRLRCFPTLLSVDDLSAAMPRHIGTLRLPIEGPLEQFTAMQDLEKGEIRVWGASPKGFVRYRIRASGQSVQVIIDKMPVQPLEQLHIEGELKLRLQIFDKGENFEGQVFPVRERLSLGVHKAQDWELIRRRGCFEEIFPFWYALGQSVPASSKNSTGTAALLEECRKVIQGKQPEKILSGFKHLWLAGFEGGLSPRLQDTDFQGIILSSNFIEAEATPLQLLSRGYQLIRSLFIQEEEHAITLLPALPPDFHCGRLLHANCQQTGVLHMEWSKKMLRRAVFLANASGILLFHFSRGEKRCRLRCAPDDKGTEYHSGEEIQVSAGVHYWLDNFQK
jgi:hypothetical protein